MGRNARLAGAVLIAMACLAGHRQAAAQSADDRAGARAAAMEGNKALRESRWADAIDLFTRAESLVHAPPHLLYMARAQVELGLLVEARENLMRVTRETLAPDAPHAFKTAQEEAESEIKAVTARLPYVTVTVKNAGAAEVSVTQDGNRIPNALIGVPRPVNPGQHTYEAISGALRATGSLTIKEAERQRVVLELKPGEGGTGTATTSTAAGKTASTPVSTSGAPSPAEAPSSPPPTKDTGTTGAEETGGMNGMRLGSYISFGVGGAGLIAGTIFALNSKSKFSQSNDLYNKNDCNNASPGGAGPICPTSIQSQIKDLDSQGASARTLGIVGFVVGGLGVAGGVTLFVLSGDKKQENAAHTSPGVRVAGAPGFVSVAGTF